VFRLSYDVKDKDSEHDGMNSAVRGCPMADENGKAVKLLGQLVLACICYNVNVT
jgi:hypothetical protein